MNLHKMMKQVQEAQAKMAQVQEDLAKQTVEATSGGGKVKVVMGGDGALQSLVISPEVVDPNDVEMLQDLVVAAVNEGKRKSAELVSREMRKAAGTMGLPPGIL